jgi:hypothetical protein
MSGKEILILNKEILVDVRLIKEESVVKLTGVCAQKFFTAWRRNYQIINTVFLYKR